MYWRSNKNRQRLLIPIGIITVIVSTLLFFKQQIVDQFVLFRHESSNLYITYKENKKLKEVIKRAELQNSKLLQMEFENEYLTKAYETKLKLPETYLASRIIGEIFSIPNNIKSITFIKIDLGELDGIKINDAVISVDQYLIGMVTETSDHTSTVQLLNSEEFLTKEGIAVTVGSKNKSFGILEYDLTINQPIITKIPEINEVQAKDVIETIGGEGSKYPAHMRLGTVTDVGPGGFGLSYQASVELPKFPKLDDEFVFIVK
ncbi:rod shape-determining protein MreC [Cohnella boryungensis]|uniref:Cell shape-determining protein MreC n=1 Tax=Cohnella boryungensis TaxID=768479 RepID=A0ABV8SH50_9BACL